MLTAFVFIMLISLRTDYTSDDFKYHFVFDTMGLPHAGTRRISGLWDIIISMKNHWRLCNGRVVAHGLLQAVLPFGKLFFKVFNSAVYVGLGYLIYKHSTYGKKANLPLLAGIYALMWFFLPQFGMTVLWASAASNYLWCSVIILSFLLPYRIYASGGMQNDSGRQRLLMSVFGLFAGCTNENSGGGLALMCLLFVIFYKIKGMKIPKWSVCGIGSTVLGAAFLIAAPGNYRISSKADLAELLIRFKDVFDKSVSINGTLAIITAVLAALVILDKTRQSADKRDYLVPVIYLIGSYAMAAVMIFSELRPERTWFMSTVAYITAAGWLFSELNFDNLKPAFVTAARWLAALAVTALFVCSFVRELAVVNTTYVQVAAGVEAINTAVREGRDSVTIPIPVPSESKYDAYNGTGYVKEPENDWMNAWMEAYYGIRSIKGEKADK